jgi:hypothetical protein
VERFQEGRSVSAKEDTKKESAYVERLGDQPTLMLVPPIATAFGLEVVLTDASNRRLHSKLFAIGGCRQMTGFQEDVD